MTSLFAGLALILAGGAVAWFGQRTAHAARWYRALFIVGCAVGVVAPLQVLLSHTPVAAAVRATTPGGPWLFAIDALSATLLIVIFAVGAACAAFGTRTGATADGYAATGLGHAAFAVLFAAIVGVVIAHSVVAFLVTWELMAISSYVLIVTDHERDDVRRAGLIYLIATHTATLALFAMFAVWAPARGDWSFEALSAAWPALAPNAQLAVVLLATSAFGVKAGLVPLHLWLPPAHAAAPSHVSAVMSGIVIKTGVYGILRVILLMGGAPAWWGWLLLAIGTASAVLGVLWALAQHDLKRLLAYHSVENVGIIVMSTGVGVLGVAHGMPAVAALGFAGAVLHTVNHALFKSVLFLGAGSVVRAVGTRHIDALGGLARGMPLTSLAFIIGATAIIGVPPLNGFVSEWLVFQGLMATGMGDRVLHAALLGVPALALVGALALACFAKVTGVVFLGRPRSAQAAVATERGAWMTAPPLALAGACVVLGIVPAIGISLVRDAVVGLAGPGANAALGALAETARTVSQIALVAGGVAAALWGARALVLDRTRVRHAATWGCGFPTSTPRTQYTASSFAAPLLSMFGRLSGVRARRTANGVHTTPRDLALDAAAVPLWHALRRMAQRLRPIQQGRLSLYLLYVMATLICGLAYIALGAKG